MSWKKLQPLEPESLHAIDWNLDEECFHNDRYLVQRRKAVPGASEVVRADNLDEPLWLIVQRLDGQPARDWRHLQRIKSELAGPEREALELYPAESRVVDSANQTHIWILAAGERVPFGFDDRVVIDAGERDDGAVQRALDDDGDAPARASVGRNAPCPCGSGRKYKRCCGA